MTRSKYMMPCSLSKLSTMHVITSRTGMMLRPNPPRHHVSSSLLLSSPSSPSAVQRAPAEVVEELTTGTAAVALFGAARATTWTASVRSKPKSNSSSTGASASPLPSLAVPPTLCMCAAVEIAPRRVASWTKPQRLNAVLTTPGATNMYQTRFKRHGQQRPQDQHKINTIRPSAPSA